eukprot:TRINITY_DN769_c0_g2_i8.p1 TRINITY_DN769_c0_g2~~TRINITY_DN769_c0_g2_i8.p1  ORF type:complete len:139 (-),score=23.87 TRINITY_DN769_c0_g2_i8:124-540(-)
MAQTSQFFRYFLSENVAEIVLNQPDKLNTLSIPWALELEQFVIKAEEDEQVRCILIWAEGRMFTAGLDLKQSSTISSAGFFPILFASLVVDILLREFGRVCFFSPFGSVHLSCVVNDNSISKQYLDPKLSSRYISGIP